MKELIKTEIIKHWLLVPLIIFSEFGFGYQAIPVFSWFYIPVLLLYTRYQPQMNILIVFVVSSFARTFCYLGTFRDNQNGPRFPEVWMLLLASMTMHLIILLPLYAERYVLSHSHCIWTRVLVFPCLWTVLWTLSARYGAIGDYPSMSTALITWPDFAQVASLGGRPLLDFLLAFFGTCILEIGTLPLQCFSKNSILLMASSVDANEDDESADGNNERNVQNSAPLRKRQYIELLVHPFTIFCGIMTLAITYGGANVDIHAGSFYQNSYSQYIPKTEQVGCVVGPGSDYPELASQHDLWFNRSAALAEAGAKLIIWSELTASVKDMDEEFEFLQKAKKLAVAHKTYLGVTYAAVDPVGQNKFVFITKEGEIAIDYNKAHPVPSIETQPAGPAVLQYVDTDEFGRIGSAICFDFNFPQFISQASALKIDVMLQPSWTWGPVGTYHQQTNELRAVENGFTLFRCVSQGVSGIFEPTLNGIFNQKVASLNVEQYLFYLPLQKRVATLYGFIGDSFSFFCFVFSAALLILVYRKNRQNQLGL